MSAISSDFLKKYNHKFETGEKINREDVQVIWNAFSSLPSTEAFINKQFQAAPAERQAFRAALNHFGSNLRKEEFEQACKAVPYDYQTIISAVDRLAQYVDELDKKSKSVKRKETDGMPKGQQ